MSAPAERRMNHAVMAGGGLRFTLPLPPSANHAYRRYTTKTGRRMNVITKAGTDWMAAARVLTHNAAVRSGWTCLNAGKVIVELTCYWPDKRRRDVSNLDKLLLDALEGVVYDDDRWALPRWMDFMTDKAHPRVEVVVKRA